MLGRKPYEAVRLAHEKRIGQYDGRAEASPFH
jgi:hypothetical protein